MSCSSLDFPAIFPFRAVPNSSFTALLLKTRRPWWACISQWQVNRTSMLPIAAEMYSEMPTALLERRGGQLKVSPSSNTMELIASHILDSLHRFSMAVEGRLYTADPFSRCGSALCVLNVDEDSLTGKSKVSSGDGILGGPFLLYVLVSTVVCFCFIINLLHFYIDARAQSTFIGIYSFSIRVRKIIPGEAPAS